VEYHFETKLLAVATAFFNDNKDSDPHYPFKTPSEQAEELRPLADFVVKTFDEDVEYYAGLLAQKTIHDHTPN
jgi:hypothetical protein